VTGECATPISNRIPDGTALGAISAHIKTYVNPNPKVFAINRASAAAENAKFSSES
jgi:hypothetical protein